MRNMILKVASVAMVLCMLMMCSASFYATDSVSYILAEDVTVSQKDTTEIEIPVSVSENQGMMGFMLLLSYDSNILEPVSVSRGEALGAGFFNDSIGSSEDGLLKVMWTGSENSYSDGLLFTVKFRLLTADFTSTQVKFEYSQPDTFDESYEDVVLSFDNANVCRVLTGDVNLDNVVNIADATQIQKYLVDLATFDEIQKNLADVNNDGVVSILDSTEIQKYIADIVDKLG